MVATRDAFQMMKKGKVFGPVAKRMLKHSLQMLDMEAAMATWQGAYLRATKQLKYAERKAIRYADDVTIRTQASAAAADISPIQRSRLGRTLTLFQTFVINEWNFMVKDVLGFRNPNVKGYERFKRISRFIIGTTLVNMFYEDVLGLYSPYPSPIKAYFKAVEAGEDTPSAALEVGRELIEKVPIISGARYGAVGPAWLSKTAKTIYTGKKIPETVATLVGAPGTSEVAKFLRARERGENLYGQIIGRYTPKPKKKRFMPSRGMGGL
jgi:hypothetical protein